MRIQHLKRDYLDVVFEADAFSCNQLVENHEDGSYNEVVVSLFSLF